jgi:hypothetical protein
MDNRQRHTMEVPSLDLGRHLLPLRPTTTSNPKGMDKHKDNTFCLKDKDMAKDTDKAP